MAIFIVTLIAVCVVWYYVYEVIRAEEKRLEQERRKNLYGYSNTKPNLEEKYDDYTGGIDEMANASFTNVVKEVFSDITGVKLDNSDDPINNDDDDDPIKFM